MSDSTSNPTPPAGGPQPMWAGPDPVRQLARKPDSMLGGVASGLAHYLGVDVSLVRIAFVLLVFFSGIGLLGYLIGWLVIPRAEHWPPSGTSSMARSLSGRDVAIGLIGVVVLIAMFANGGFTARLVVSVLLVGGGIWLLRQPEAVGAPARMATLRDGAPPGSLPVQYPTPASTPVETGAVGPWPPPTVPAAEPSPFSAVDAPQPVDVVVPPPPVAGASAPSSPPPPRRRRLVRLLALVAFLLAIPVLIIIVVIGLFISGRIEVGSGFEATYRPTTIEAIPSSIRHETGEIVLDLTLLDVDDFIDAASAPAASSATDAGAGTPSVFGADGTPDAETIELPISISIDLDVGQIRVIVPEELASRIDIEAEVGIGDLEVLDSSNSGLGNDITTNGDEPVLTLELDTGIGQISVVED